MQLFTNIQAELISRIEQANKSVRIAVTWFTNHDLYEAILKKLESPAFKVDLIVLNDRINNKREGIEFQRLIDKGGNFYYSEVERMVHHKFCIIDEDVVMTGSYNWTYYAENRNWENLIVADAKETVNGYIAEFERVISAHQKVQNVSEVRKMTSAMEVKDYLQSDYLFQAENENTKGNALAVAKVYTELLKLNPKQQEVEQKRAKIINSFNKDQFDVCPFEIGIEFISGYLAIIPAFSKLPITVTKVGRNTYDNATSLKVPIQKYDYYPRNILQFSINGLRPSPANTDKIEITLNVTTDGILHVNCREINGNNQVAQTRHVDLRKV